MSHITLIRPANVSAIAAYSVPTTPPIGVAYLAANLRHAGHGVAVIDALGEAPLQSGPTEHAKLIYHGLTNEQIVERIDPDTDAIGISTMFSQEWLHTSKLIAEIHRRHPEVPIIIGGEHATATWEYVLNSCPAVLVCALGEGDQTILDLARYLAGELRLDEISGIAYRQNGRAVRTPARERIRELDEIPWPAWDLLPIERYLSGGFGHGVDLGRSMPVLATRGCPYQCTFCSCKAMWTTRYHMRSVQAVIDEIEHYVSQYQATNIDFYDLTAIVKREWILDFCRELERRGLRITWQLPSGTRSEALDEDVLRALHRTGCRNITYSPESGSPATLRRIKKRIKLPQMVRSIRTAARVGLRVKCNLIIGFPDETRADVWRTVLLALKMAFIGVQDTGLYMLSPYPGSELYEDLRCRGLVGELGDEYFASLACFMDLAATSGGCERIGPRELNVYRVLGMACFYGLSFAARPWRAVRTAWNIWRNRSATVLEQRLCDLKKRCLAHAQGA